MKLKHPNSKKKTRNDKKANEKDSVMSRVAESES